MSDLYPLDFAALNKGDFISEEKLREIFAPETGAAFAFAVLGLVEQIKRERRDLYVVQQNNGIAVLTDTEAEKHSVLRFEQTVRREARIVRDRARIDTSEFSESQKRESEHWDTAMSAHALDSMRRLRKAKRDAVILASGNVKKELLP